MLTRTIPGVGELHIATLLLDYNGTIASGGKLLAGVADDLARLARELEVVVATADTFGSARRELQGLPVRLERIAQKGQDEAKETVCRQLGAHGGVVALGNGANDVRMLRAAQLGIGVLGDEGMYAPLVGAADVVVHDVRHAFGLLLEERRLAATLRR